MPCCSHCLHLSPRIVRRVLLLLHLHRPPDRRRISWAAGCHCCQDSRCWTPSSQAAQHQLQGCGASWHERWNVRQFTAELHPVFMMDAHSPTPPSLACPADDLNSWVGTATSCETTYEWEVVRWPGLEPVASSSQTLSPCENAACNALGDKRACTGIVADISPLAGECITGLLVWRGCSVQCTPGGEACIFLPRAMR